MASVAVGDISLHNISDANKKRAKCIAARAMINKLIENGKIVVPNGIALQIEHTFSTSSIFDNFKQLLYMAFQQVFNLNYFLYMI